MPRKRKTLIREKNPDLDEHAENQEDWEEIPLAQHINVKEETAQNPLLDALKDIHMEIQKIQQGTHILRFLMEAEHHNTISPLLQKRADIINGTYEPTESEAIFKFRDDAPTPEREKPNGKKGIPNFWAQVMMNDPNTVILKEEDILASLKDVRVVYSKEPLGFSLHCDFAENRWFGNEELTRSYELDTDLAKEDLYLARGLMVKKTRATAVACKNGKRRWGERNFYKRGKRGGARQLIRTEVDHDSFFALFGTVATVPDTKDAEKIYKRACDLRSRVIPRALLIFTEEDNKEYR